MKTKFHEFQKNFILPTSKSSIIYLGIALTTFTNVALALNDQQATLKEELSLYQIKQSKENFLSTTSTEHETRLNGTKISEKDSSLPEDLAAFNPYEKTIAEIILEDKLITESETVLSKENIVEKGEGTDQMFLPDIQPQSTEKTMAEIIAEDSKIIESVVLEAVQTKSNYARCK